MPSNLESKIHKEINKRITKSEFNHGSIINVFDIKQKDQELYFFLEDNAKKNNSSIEETLIKLEYVACNISEEKQKELLNKLASSGFEQGERIIVKDIPKPLYREILKISPKIGNERKSRVILSILGYDVNLHRTFLHKQLIEEFKKYFTNNKQNSYEEIIFKLIHDKKKIGLRKLRKIIPKFHSYELACLKNASLPKWQTLVDNMYPEFPHLSWILNRKADISQLSMPEFRNYLFYLSEEGEDISSGGLKRDNPVIFSLLRQMGLKKLKGLELTYYKRKKSKILLLSKKVSSDNFLSNSIPDNEEFYKEFFKQYLIENDIKLVLDPEDKELKYHRFQGKEKLTGTDRTRTLEIFLGIDRIYFSQREGKKRLWRLHQISEDLVTLVLKSEIGSQGATQTDKFNKTFGKLKQVFPITEKGKDKDPKGRKLIYMLDETPNEAYADFVGVSEEDKIIQGEVKFVTGIINPVINVLKKSFDKNRNYYWLKPDNGSTTLTPVDKNVLVVHSDEYKANKIKEIVKNNEDINIDEVITSNDFKEIITKSSKSIQKYLTPNVCNTKDIFRFYDILISSPHLLLKKEFSYMVNFLSEELKSSLIRASSENQTNTIEPLTLYGHSPLKDKDFVHFNFSINSVPDNKIKTYILENIHKIPNNALFWDIETTGLSPTSSIFLIRGAYKRNNNIRFDLAFATNPMQEEEILNHLVQFTQDEGFEIYVTYNGKTFDIPRFSSRSRTWLINPKPIETVNHIDAYSLLNSDEGRSNILGYEVKNFKVKKGDEGALKLSKLYTSLFGEKPRQDPTSAQVCINFGKWLKEGKPELIQEDLHHNVIDIETMIAVYLRDDIYPVGKRSQLIYNS